MNLRHINVLAVAGEQYWRPVDLGSEVAMAEVAAGEDAIRFTEIDGAILLWDLDVSEAQPRA
jgi:hypothetical protein